MVRIGNKPRDEQRIYRAKRKYKKVAGDKWIIDTSVQHGSVRPIDLVSRDPDCLREHVSLEAAIIFEEWCYQEAERLKAVGEDWIAYRSIPRKLLTIPDHPRWQADKKWCKECSDDEGLQER